MNDLHELAAVARARQASVPSGPAPTPLKQSGGKGAFIAVAVGLAVGVGIALIVIAVIVSGHSGPSAKVSAADQEAASSDPQADAAARSREVADVHSRLNELGLRLCETIAASHKAALQANAIQSGDLYACNCQLRGSDVTPAGVGAAYRLDCRVVIGETVTVDDGANTVSDTFSITAIFNPAPGGKWQLVSATSKKTAHTGTAELFRDPVPLRSEREITHIDWFHNAVAAAQHH